jgi:hypothetical protein
MADEIKLSSLLSFAKGGRSAEFGALGQEIDMAGTDYVRATQTIGTTAEALMTGDMTNCGVLCIKNLDPTNYVNLRAGSGGADLVKIKAGECFPLRLATNTPYAIANTAPVEVEYLLLEE